MVFVRWSEAFVVGLYFSVAGCASSPQMKMCTLLSFITLSLLLAGCNKAGTPTEGSDDTAANAPAPSASDEKTADDKTAAKDQGKKKDDHGTLPKEVQAFHDVFAPVWHIEDKAERRKKFCDAPDKILEASDVFAEMKAPPGVDAEGWKKATYDLVAYIADADRVCGDKPKVFDNHLTGAHDALHKLMELSAKN
jgi:hypothetical protein